MNVSRWSKPKVYSTIVGLYFLVFSGIVLGHSSYLVIQQTETTLMNRVAFLIILNSALAPLYFAGVWLLTKSEKEISKALGYGVLIYLGIGAFWASLFWDEGWDTYSGLLLIFGGMAIYGIMFFLLHKRYFLKAT
jgi:hypothetical protein